MNLYPDRIQSLILQLASLLTSESDVFKGSLAEINSAVAYYPNCHVGGYFEDLRANPNIPTLMIQVNQDKIVGHELCQEVADDINQRKGSTFITTTSYDAEHAFDMLEDPGYQPELKERAANQTLSFIQDHQNKCPKPATVIPDGNSWDMFVPTFLYMDKFW